MALVQVQVPYRDNRDYAVGVDLATGSQMGLVVGGEVSGVPGAGGATTSFGIFRIASTAAFEKKLDTKFEGT
jgi:hypothetical protein